MLQDAKDKLEAYEKEKERLEKERLDAHYLLRAELARKSLAHCRNERQFKDAVTYAAA